MAFLPSPTQMRNPRVVRWVLHRLEQAQEADDELRARELAALLDAPALQWLLGSDHEMLATDALRLLAAGHLASIQEWLFERCSTLPGSVARWASIRIAEMAPEEYRESVAAALDSGTTPDQLSGSPGLLQGLAGMGRAAGPIATRLLDGIRPASLAPWQLEAAVVLSVEAGTPHAASLIAATLKTRSSDETVASAILGTAYRTLTGGLPYFTHFEDVVEGVSKLCLADVPELFDEQAPLAELDQAARTRRGKRLKVARRLLQQREGRKIPASSLALTVLEELGRGKVGPEARDALASFCLAAVAAIHAREALDLEALETPDLLRLVSTDLDRPPSGKQLTEEISHRDADQTAQAILELLDHGRVPGDGDNLVELMACLRSDHFVDPLIRTLAGGWADYLSDRAVLALGCFGERAEAGIVDQWDRLDRTQRIYAFDVLERVGGDRTVEHLLRILPDHRAATDRLEMWCALAEAVPDPRIVDALLPELRRAHPVVDRCVVTLCDLLDLHPEGLDEAEKRNAAHDERAFRGIEALRESAEAAAGDETVRMDLACPECGDENSFAVRRLYLAAEDPKQEPYIGDDLTCPSCGFQGPFRSTRSANLSITGLLLRNLVPGLRKTDGSGPLQLVKGFVADGKQMSPAAAIQHYERRLAEQPDDAVSLLALGNTYRTLGPERLAFDCYRRGLALDPACAEAAYGLADLEADAGNHEVAWSLLDRAWTVRQDWRFHRLQGVSPGEFEESFIEAHDALARRLGQPIIGGGPRRAPALEPPVRSFSTQPAKKRKIGRNEPCPCGSGKKYKRCCLLTERT